MTLTSQSRGGDIHYKCSIDYAANIKIILWVFDIIQEKIKFKLI